MAIDLKKEKQADGIVARIAVERVRFNTGKHKTQHTVCLIQLDNSFEYFTVWRGASFANELKSKIQVGDSLRINYRATGKLYNTHVFQIEKSGVILASLEDYSRSEGKWLSLIFALGIMATVVSAVVFVRKRKPSI